MISVKTGEEIEIMRHGGKILASILSEIARIVKAGITTNVLEKKARELISYHKVKSSFLNYNGYPAVLCTALNNQIVHSVPSERKLIEGDIISLDFGIVCQGFHTDAAVTLPVLGELSYDDWRRKNKGTAKLLDVTKHALSLGIAKVKAGRHLGEISHAIQEYVESSGFSVVRDLSGHGIGRQLHEQPYVPNFGGKNDGPVLEAGMTMAIEPMVTAGDWKVIQGEDGFSFDTADGSLAAHFEHTILVTENGADILTIA